MKIIGLLMTLCGDTQNSQLDAASRALPPEITLLLGLFHKIVPLSLFQCGQPAMFPHLSLFWDCHPHITKPQPLSSWTTPFINFASVCFTRVFFKYVAFIF